MKRILFITAFPPNRLTAGQNYTRQLLNDLSSTYEIDLVYFKYKNHPIEINDKVNVLIEANNSTYTKLINAFKLLYIHPFFSSRYNKKIVSLLKSKSNDYNAIYFDFSQVFIYSLFINHPYKIMMCHDIITQKYIRSRAFKWSLNYIFVKYSERRLITNARQIYCFSKKDSKLAKNLFKINIEPVAFYIDESINVLSYNNIKSCNYYALYAAWNRKENEEGLMWLINNVLPFIPEQNIVIMGPSLSQILKKKIANKSNIKYLGFVDNPFIILMQSKALIAPLFNGAGVKVKVIESLATGTPVIGNEIAFEGIENIKVGTKMALNHFNSASDLIEILNNYTAFDKKERIELQSSFNHNYKTDKLTNKIKTS